MDVLDAISEPVLFARQLHEHSQKIHQGVELVAPLADALLAEDYEKIKTLRKETTRIADEARQMRLLLCDQIKDMHFRSAGGYAFNQYLAHQDKMAELSQGFADLLMLRRTTIPGGLHADFRAFVSRAITVCEEVAVLTEVLSSEGETVAADADAPNVLDAMRGISDGNWQVRQLGRKFAQRVYELEEQLGPVSILFLDKCCTALQELADNAEQVVCHLHLMIR
jgi:predicted phosphate transport protein (TIGR00153 family)